jgi:hypothetical protein
LVKHFGRGKGWSVPEHNIEELQAFDMTAQHDKAHRQGCCQDKADGPQSAVQNVAEATTATGESPVLCP